MTDDTFANVDDHPGSLDLVAGTGADDDFADVDEHPGSLDLPVRRRIAAQEHARHSRKVASAVLSVVGTEPDDYQGVDDHPGCLDLLVRA